MGETENKVTWPLATQGDAVLQVAGDALAEALARAEKAEALLNQRTLELAKCGEANGEVGLMNIDLQREVQELKERAEKAEAERDEWIRLAKEGGPELLNALKLAREAFEYMGRVGGLGYAVHDRAEKALAAIKALVPR